MNTQEQDTEQSSTEQTGPQTGPIKAEQKAAQQTEATTSGPTTGPLDDIKTWWGNTFGGRQTQSKPPKQPKEPRAKTSITPPPPDERSAIEKMRDKVAEFDEDYKDLGERLLGGFAQLIGYVGPFLLVLWVGSDLGKFFAPTMDLAPAYGMAYTIEGIIAACTVSMGRGFAEIASGKANYGKLFIVGCIWLVLNASSALGLYLVITNNNAIPQGGIEQASMMIRVIAVALGDLGCAAVLMFKGQSLQKNIESMRKRATAIGELADAQRSIEEADKNAALREQQLKATLKIQEDLSQKIGDAVSMVMESILDKMEKALKDDKGKNERGYGSR